LLMFEVGASSLLPSISLFLFIFQPISSWSYIFLFRVSDSFEIDERSLNDFLPLMLVLIRYGTVVEVFEWWPAPFSLPKWWFLTCFSEKSTVFPHFLKILVWWLLVLAPL
jgi:hypothetical protein